ncbi:MAG: hypothetical protein US62_C0004G0014 [Candidatus Woesebacteria bacterium GW2011_GWA1_37_8]|uniref:Uncharacterized protein n=2 Tax=Candidatus Woeseibacteriota TaxID=1752722 RepID=A0A0G0L9G1_9BACT|nr:MAG: coiled-coil [Microgenomates group bacterium GW2011_GWC1_37_12b]KKQ46201.1 MAG: hypothetical protein US62_C0004G0014 [Candidatus Woesebacteria bacterium GW2011_GWA1_37_8]KKQ87612.1 MAG: hypothetical protein UT10_C0003G0016 [Candidatus Woesebacteria bacterium GW2011_GWB1_38_8b]
MTRKITLLLFIFFFAVFYSQQVSNTGFNGKVLLAQSEEEKLTKLKNDIEQYEKELARLTSAASTLQNQIAQFDTQIKLTQLKIAQTEEQINLLGGRIDRLGESLTSLTTAFNERAVQTYKMAILGQPLYLLVTAPNLNQAVSSYHYLKRIQNDDMDLLNRLQNAQDLYKTQKTDQEKLQADLEKQRANLASQKNAKASLLTQTKNDEKKYQQLLASAKSEFEAIQAIISGRGEEEKVGPVSAGARIASIIDGPSCNSSGRHTHFIVKDGANVQNPFSYLKPGIDFENCSGSSCGSGDGDSFNPGGSWDWPINAKVKFTQGYGSTWAVRNTWVGRVYSSHNGIDVDSASSTDIKAVKTGTLYRGSYSGSGGCRLRYVRVDHDDSEIETYYLHVNY